MNFLLGTRKIIYSVHSTRASRLKAGMPVELSGVEIGRIINLNAETPHKIDFQIEINAHYRKYLHPDAYLKTSLRNVLIPDKISTPKLILDPGSLPGELAGKTLPFSSDWDYHEKTRVIMNRIEDNVIRFLERIDTPTLMRSVDGFKEKIPAFGRATHNAYIISEKLNSREGTWGKYLHDDTPIRGIEDKMEYFNSRLVYYDTRILAFSDTVSIQTRKIKAQTKKIRHSNK